MSFKDIFGQERQIDILRRSLEGGRLSHAYLFFGARGIGKMKTALELAKAVNCRDAVNDACDVCPSCRKIDHGNHPDILFVRPEGSTLKIAQVRNIQENLKFAPLEGRARFILMDDAERMNIPAANSLLKTLEEPRVSNVLILITPLPDKLPRTVLSRCRKMRFSPLHQDTMATFLVESKGIGRGEAQIIAASCGGSPGKALDMIEGSALARGRKLIENIATPGIEKDLSMLMETVGLFETKREEILDGLDMLKRWFRDILVFRETGTEEGLFNRDIFELTRARSSAMTAEGILACMKTIDWTADAIEKNANKQLTLETMVFKLASSMR